MIKRERKNKRIDEGFLGQVIIKPNRVFCGWSILRRSWDLECQFWSVLGGGQSAPRVVPGASHTLDGHGTIKGEIRALIKQNPE